MRPQGLYMQRVTFPPEAINQYICRYMAPYKLLNDKPAIIFEGALVRSVYPRKNKDGKITS
jgi:hypothetical protein